MSRNLLFGALAGGAIVLALAGGVAWAAIPGGGNVYTACMLKNVGTVRLIDKSLPQSNIMSRCTSLEVEVSWNHQGPKGDKGESCSASDPACIGSKGDKGDKGDPGTNGTNGTN